MKLRTIIAPKPQKCRECKAETCFEFDAGMHALVEQEMHHCTCSKSEYRKKCEACKASGGHDFETVSAGSHSFDVCVKCGAHG